MTTILKATSKGQVTIPAKWRKQFNTNQFVATLKGDKMEIRPLVIKEDVGTPKDITVFDAIRDNKGRGIKASDLLKIIDKTL